MTRPTTRSARVVLLAAGVLLPGVACRNVSGEPVDHAEQRRRMVRDQIAARGVQDPRVLEAMRKVPRHEFLPEAMRRLAHADRPAPIGHRQTISQPFIVAYMTEAIRPKPGDRVLEIGTGSGYQAAVLAEVVKDVYSIEIVKPLALRAKKVLRRLGHDNVKLRIGDGYKGWPEAAPFDAILVTAAPPRVPKPLLEQLKVGGRLVMPVGERWQKLIRITRTAKGYEREELMDVRFVPMTGEVRRRGAAPSTKTTPGAEKPSAGAKKKRPAQGE